MLMRDEVTYVRYRSVQMDLDPWLDLSCDSRQGVSGASGAAAFSASRAPERKSLDTIQVRAANDRK